MHLNKYVLIPENYQFNNDNKRKLEVNMHSQVNVLCVLHQIGVGLCLWVLENKESQKDWRKFEIFKDDGIIATFNHHYVGSASHSMLGDAYHVFEVLGNAEIS